MSVSVDAMGSRNAVATLPLLAPSREKHAALISTALAVLLAALVLLVPLGHKPLAAWDEGIYAEVSREMLGGSWLVPHWNGQLWFEKPPLMLWITALLFKVFGINEFAARAGSAFSGVAIVGMLHGWLARRRDSIGSSDQLAAWLSTFMLLSTFGFLHICSLGETDVLLSLGCLLALLGLVRVQAGEASGWYGFWLGFAVALMTKGAASVVLLCTLVAFAALQYRNPGPGPARVHSSFLPAFGLFLLLVLPWHVFMYARFGHAFVQEYLGFHVLVRATAQIEDHVTHPWYYFGVLLVSAAPWVLLYPFAAAAPFRPAAPPSQDRPRSLRILASFALIVLLFYSAVQTRLPHYIAPVYPVLTLLSAIYAAHKLRAWGVPQAAAAKRAGWVLLALGAWGASALLTKTPRQKLHAAKLTHGVVPPDSRETAHLLKELRRQPGLPGGPLLLWRQAGYASIAPAVFYAQRPVQQVQLGPPDPNQPTDKYLHAPQDLSIALAAEPGLLLVDRALLPSLPSGYIVTPLATSATLEAGVISRRR